MITISHPNLIFITGTLIPVVTGLLTHWSLPGWVKGLVAMLLNAIVAFLTVNTVGDTAVFSTLTLWTAVSGFILSVVMHRAIWQHTPFTSSKKNNMLAPNFGIGMAHGQDS